MNKNGIPISQAPDDFLIHEYRVHEKTINELGGSGGISKPPYTILAMGIIFSLCLIIWLVYDLIYNKTVLFFIFGRLIIACGVLYISFDTYKQDKFFYDILKDRLSSSKHWLPIIKSELLRRGFTINDIK